MSVERLRALCYADASALVKLVLDEPESDALRAALEEVDLVSSALVLAEVPRAIRRACAGDPRLPLERLVGRAGQVLAAVALHPVSQKLLAGAGALDSPALRTLDAIHVASAAMLAPIDAFVTYDVRQADAARLAGLPTLAPAG